ncbi:MAG: radical SAM protein [Defluviitaleaceae bacterium]|nr:radical SAM protein [Defluviitaleaceae bacterium]
MHTKIFFGIDSKLKAQMDSYITAHGEPNAVCAEDSILNLWKNKKYMNKYDVISFDDAIKKFPKADVFITYAHTPTATKAAKKIAKKVSRDKIYFLAADVEYRKSCGSLGSELMFSPSSVATCSIESRIFKSPKVKFKKDISVVERINIWYNLVTDIIENARYGRSTTCDNCPRFKLGLYPKQPSIKKLLFTSDLPKSTCNFKCTYCITTENNTWKKLRDVKGPTTRDVIKELSQMSEFNREDFIVYLANGEPLAGRYANEILDILLASKWKLDIISNSGIYREKLVTLMDSGRIGYMVTSLDCGTRETFKKIKQVDRFDAVLSNLRRLPLHKIKTFYLKYIFLQDINDNDAEVDAFYEIAKELKVDIMLSVNSIDKDRSNWPYTDKMRILTENIIKKAKTDGLKVGWDENRMHPTDQKFIRETYKNYKPVL